MVQLCSTITTQLCCHRAGLPILPIRRPLRSCALASRLQAQTQRCRCRSSAGSNIVAAQLVSPGSAQLARQPAQPQFLLFRSQLANKQVVTRTDGQILGVVDQLLADPSTFRVVALSCKPSPDMLAGDVPKQLGLMSLKQISDVLLVHDSRALLKQPLTIGLGYVQLVGTVVKTAEGKVVGKVRDFLFSPDDGRIMELRIDALGIPALPERLLGCLGVRIQLVHHIAYNCITLQPGAEAYIDKISPGAFDGAVELLKGYLPFIGSGSSEAEESRDDPAYVEWYLSYGQAYEQLNGKRIARPSDLALQSALEARRVQQPPAALPPGRQPSYESQLQPQTQPQYQSQLEYQQAEAELADSYFPQQAPPGSPALQPGPYDQQSQPLPDDRWQQQQQQQQQSPPPYLQAQPQQANQQVASGPRGSTLPPPAGKLYAASPNKLEQQQRRFAARADATITEPRFDPRRRRTGMSPEQTPPPAFREASSSGMSQGRAGAAAAASRLSYTPERGSGAQGSQGSARPQAAQMQGPVSQGTSEQPSSEQGRWQFEGQRYAQPGGGSEAYQDKQTPPSQQSFDSWADVSPSPVQPVAVMPNGTVDTAAP